MIIIDGYNYLYKHPRYETAEQLSSAVCDFASYFKKKVIIVFDGEWEYDGEYDTDRCFVDFVKDADSQIIDYAMQYPRSIIVTSDREIRRSVRKYRCTVIHSADFSLLLPENGLDDEKPTVDEASVQDYLDLFS